MKNLSHCLCIFLTCISFAPVFAESPTTSPSASPVTGARPEVEICFVLDTTGSMGGLIEGAKAKIWSIANNVISQNPKPHLKVALVPYRDRGDEYITKVFDLTDDMDAVFANLQSFKAQGGGDGPEDVNQALDDGVNKIKWSADDKVTKIMFLVGDAPPHTDYKGEKQYVEICRDAIKKNVIINTVQCGNQSDTAPVWQEIAKSAEGSYVCLPQDGGMVVRSTPVDDKLMALNRDIDQTAIIYGNHAQQMTTAAKARFAAIAPASVAIDRAAYNAKDSARAVQGNGDLVTDLQNGQAKLSELKKDELPSIMQDMTIKEQMQFVKQQEERRSELQKQLLELTSQRDKYLKDEAEKDAAASGGPTRDSFDNAVNKITRDDMARRR